MSEKDERLKKIDEIERAMHDQWLKAKSLSPSAHDLVRHWRSSGQGDVDLIMVPLHGGSVEIVEMKKSPGKKSVTKIQRIEIAPGFGLHSFLRSVCTKRFTEDVLDQLLQDGTDMHQQYLADGDFAAAKRVRWAMRWWMLRSMFGGALAALIGLLVGKKKTSD